MSLGRQRRGSDDRSWRTFICSSDSAVHNSVALNTNDIYPFRIKHQTLLVRLWKTKCIRQCAIQLESKEISNELEVRMQFMKLTTVRTSADVISGILNGVCPECGGRMGGPGKEFKCQGECQTDWRQVWERVLSAGLDWGPNRTIHSSRGLRATERD